MVCAVLYQHQKQRIFFWHDSVVYSLSYFPFYPSDITHLSFCAANEKIIDMANVIGFLVSRYRNASKQMPVIKLMYSYFIIKHHLNIILFKIIKHDKTK